MSTDHLSESLVKGDGLLEAPVNAKKDSWPGWGWCFFWNPYCEDWPQYGRKNAREAEAKVPTLKCSLQQDPSLLDCDRIPALTMKDGLANVKFIAAIVVLSAQIASLMSLAKQFSDGVKEDTKKQFTGFEAATRLLTFMPLMFAAMIPFMYNSKRSKEAFFHCLARGYLLDFPDQVNPTYFATHQISLAYVIGIGAYASFAIYMFLRCEAPVTIWIIFGTSLGSGVATTWLRHFRIEHDLVSLTKFVQSVDDRGEIAAKAGLPSRPIVDSYTMTKAADLLKKLKPLRCRAPFKDYTWVLVFRNRGAKQWIVRIAVLLIACAFGGAMFGLFTINANTSDEDKWKNLVSPCTQVCFDHENRAEAQCFNCMCDCATTFGVVFDQKLCSKLLVVRGCDATTSCSGTCGGRGG
jgi:hypothetical protein